MSLCSLVILYTIFRNSYTVPVFLIYDIWSFSPTYLYHSRTRFSSIIGHLFYPFQQPPHWCQMAKPTFVLLHGAWHSPRCWSRLIPELEKAGYSAIAPALPSCGSTPPTPDWEGDIEVIRQTVSDLVVEQDVVVVMHSFSGMTGGTALEGLDKKSCLAKGLKGGVVRLVYIVAFLVPEGFQHSPHGTRDQMVPQMKTDLEVSTMMFPIL
jgi:pimeloyl-ACP methyl ester carboxylesterase